MSQPPLFSQSLFEKIRQHPSAVPSVEDCLPWLEHEGLTRSVPSYQPPDSLNGDEVLPMGQRVLRGVPCQRAERWKKAELDDLKKRYKPSEGHPSHAVLEAIWHEYKNPRSMVLSLDIQRLPADALAFYRPFHFSPYEEWGIYIMVGRLLSHCHRMYGGFQGKLRAFNTETLAGCVLFEVFHHEFFHHLVECAATTVEILSAAFGKPKAVYNDYWNYRFEKNEGLGPHPHKPLEEALANAYAYNSLSFISRMQLGYKVVWVKLYQEILKKCWPVEPQGYRDAAEYIEGSYVAGAAQLLAMVVSSASLDPSSLLLLAKAVMPNGNSAFLQKPDIPTYLVGNEEALRAFQPLVPAPNETYTSLFWLGDTTEVDNYLLLRKQQEKQAKKTERRK